MLQKMKKILIHPAVRYPVLVLIGLVIGLSAYFLNASSVLGNPFPMPFGYGLSVIVTGSMEPTLSAGDLVIIQEQETYTPGDIVAYQQGTMGVIHRLMEINADVATTQGDANNVPDEGIPMDAIRGCVIWSVPKLGRYINILKSPVCILVMIALAVLLMEMSFRAEKEKKKAETDRLREEIQRLRAEIE